MDFHYVPRIFFEFFMIVIIDTNINNTSTIYQRYVDNIREAFFHESKPYALEKGENPGVGRRIL